jgi:hypothetical protein
LWMSSPTSWGDTSGPGSRFIYPVQTSGVCWWPYNTLRWPNIVRTTYRHRRTHDDRLWMCDKTEPPQIRGGSVKSRCPARRRHSRRSRRCLLSCGPSPRAAGARLTPAYHVTAISIDRRRRSVNRSRELQQPGWAAQ